MHSYVLISRTQAIKSLMLAAIAKAVGVKTKFLAATARVVGVILSIIIFRLNKQIS